VAVSRNLHGASRAHRPGRPTHSSASAHGHFSEHLRDMAEGTHCWRGVAALRALLRCSSSVKEEDGAGVVGATAASRKKRARAAEVLRQCREDDGAGASVVRRRRGGDGVGRLPRSGRRMVKHGRRRGGRGGRNGRDVCQCGGTQWRTRQFERVRNISPARTHPIYSNAS
jgi:hypothetical protein